ncbi:MAG: hypothetical protein RL189_3011 [Pseudomonadota bacterium]|jgi:sec-independent protein translocase protein TatA
MPNIGFPELLLVLGIALLLFGNRLPTVGKSLGEGIRNFKKGLSSDDSEEKQAQTTQPQQNQATPPQQVAAQNVQHNSLQSPQAGQQGKVDFVDVEHRDSNK